jgi:hypothetical protein
MIDVNEIASARDRTPPCAFVCNLLQSDMIGPRLSPDRLAILSTS